MSEKVLGFRKSHASTTFFCAEGVYTIPEDKLVPVVSLTWLKKLSKDIIEEEEYTEGSDFKEGFNRGLDAFKKRLLSAAKKEASKNG